MDPIYEAVVRLGTLVLRFGQTYRKTFFQDGETPESDTDHTVMLGLIACAYAERKAPHLDRGKIAQYALVHDLVEAYAGDTPTFKKMTSKDKEEKEAREHEAFIRIKDEFEKDLPWIVETIEQYESLATPEARFVKAIDKSMPCVTHLHNGAITVRNAGFDKKGLDKFRTDFIKQMREGYAQDQPQAIELYDVLLQQVVHEML